MMRILLAIVATAGVSACGIFQKDKKPEEKKPIPKGPQLIGLIASVPVDQTFVLIQSYEPVTFADGTILTTRAPEERTANLRVTGEKLGQFFAADVQAGTVKVGDAVFSHPVAEVKSAQTMPRSTSPAETGNSSDAPQNPAAATASD